jgi:hypothetical protein
MTQESVLPQGPRSALPPRRRTGQPPPPSSQTKAMLIKPSRRHSRKCAVCHHLQRHLIEFFFLQGASPSAIAEYFEIHDRGTIYHHAHATHLFEARQISHHHRQANKSPTRWHLAENANAPNSIPTTVRIRKGISHRMNKLQNTNRDISPNVNPSPVDPVAIPNEPNLNRNNRKDQKPDHSSNEQLTKSESRT